MTMLNWIPCYYESLIEYNAENLSQQLFNTMWITSDLKHKKMLFIYQTILQMKKIQIRIGNFSSSNIASFWKLLKFAYSMVAFLRSLK